MNIFFFFITNIYVNLYFNEYEKQQDILLFYFLKHNKAKMTQSYCTAIASCKNKDLFCLFYLDKDTNNDTFFYLNNDEFKIFYLGLKAGKQIRPTKF